MTPTSDSTSNFPPAARFGRLYALARSAFALFGFGIALLVAYPAAREALLLRPLDPVAWQPRLQVAAIAPPAAAAREATAFERSEDEARRSGYPAADVARPTPVMHAVAHPVERRDERALLAQFIAKRFRVADEVVADYVDAAYSAGEAHALDPLILLAMVATESGYNPIAESVVGAKGLMQIIAKFHPEKLAGHGGETALLEPAVNIRVGAQILQEYLRRYGDLESALQMYAGALDEPTARYAKKVLAERARLRQALARAQPEA